MNVDKNSIEDSVAPAFTIPVIQEKILVKISKTSWVPAGLINDKMCTRFDACGPTGLQNMNTNARIKSIKTDQM